MAGAAGTALFVTVTSNVTASKITDGSVEIDAGLFGIHIAFLCGAVASLVAVIASFFARKLADMGDARA